MKRVMCTIRDKQRAIHRAVSPEVVTAVTAALGADPDTIEELADAAARYIHLPGDEGLFARFSAGVCVEPEDSGLCILDLPARLVVVSPAERILEHDGEIQLVDDGRDEEVWLGYSVPEDWQFTEQVGNWSHMAEVRRTVRAGVRQVDVREVLYEKVCEFIARECLVAACRGERGHDIVPSIHARWLLEPRDDLQQLAPRDLLLAKREFIDRDLQDRCDQWSRLGQCPPGLSQDSSAFRFGGFGTNELVLYYDLVRALVSNCWERVRQEPDCEVFAEIERLEAWKRVWLVTPQEDLSGFAPGDAIQRERQRLPLAVSGEAAMVDCDCPLCQMMVDSGPVFWHLDGAHMDDDFAFSLYATREEWEEEQHCWTADRPVPSSSQPQSISGDHDDRRQPASDPVRNAFLGTVTGSLELSLFALGGRLAELISELKQVNSESARPHIDALNRDFGNLRQALREGATSLVEPVAARFQEHLDELVSTRPELTDRCGELHQQVGELLCAEWRSR